MRILKGNINQSKI